MVWLNGLKQGTAKPLDHAQFQDSSGRGASITVIARQAVLEGSNSNRHRITFLKNQSTKRNKSARVGWYGNFVQ